MTISDKYSISLMYMEYGQGYDVRIHAVQSAILILYSDVLGGLNIAGSTIKISDIKFGYYCPLTEALIEFFQRNNNLNPTGKLDVNTWTAIFKALEDRKGCTLIQVGSNKIIIVDVDDFIEEEVEPGIGNKDPIFQPVGDIDYGVNIGGPSEDSDTGYGDINGWESFLDYINQFIPDGSDSSFFEYIYGNVDAGKFFDDLLYQYIVNGGIINSNISFGYNLGGGEYWHDGYLTPTHPTSSGSPNKDYDYIYNLLSNTIYEGNVDLSPMTVSSSTSEFGKFLGNFSTSTNKPFFESYTDFNGNVKNKFDLTIVYGAKGSKARKILDVMPIAFTQELDASGEPIYDIYEFIARDVIDGV